MAHQVTQYEALAAKVEGAEGASREIDAEIAATQGFRIVDEGHPLGRCCYDKAGRLIVIPRYTASLDAAMTLVPEECLFGIKTLWDGITRSAYARVAIYRDKPGDRAAKLYDIEYTAAAATPALALTTACLRAQAALSSEMTI